VPILAHELGFAKNGGMDPLLRCDSGWADNPDNHRPITDV
jgi:hypothetical protein